MSVTGLRHHVPKISRTNFFNHLVPVRDGGTRWHLSAEHSTGWYEIAGVIFRLVRDGWHSNCYMSASHPVPTGRLCKQYTFYILAFHSSKSHFTQYQSLYFKLTDKTQHEKDITQQLWYKKFINKSITIIKSILYKILRKNMGGVLRLLRFTHPVIGCELPPATG